MVDLTLQVIHRHPVNVPKSMVSTMQLKIATVLESGVDRLCEFIWPPVRVYQELGPSLAMGGFTLALLGFWLHHFSLLNGWSQQCLSDTHKVGQAETGV